MKKKKKIVLILLFILIFIAGIIAFMIFRKGNDEPILMSLDIVYEGDNDFDGDGLSNIKERDLGTDVVSIDSDKDGLNDFEEVETYECDPLRKDSDDDGLDDYNEILQGYDPNKKDFDDTKKMTVSYDYGDYKFKTTGIGNIANTRVIANNNTNAAQSEYVIKEYQLSSDVSDVTGYITVTLTEDDLKDIGFDADMCEDVDVFQLNKDDYRDIKWLEAKKDCDNLKYTFKFNNIEDAYVIGDAKNIYYEVQMRKESKSETVLLADSGFRPAKNGFRFENFKDSVFNGHCYGMSMFAEWYYIEGLPMYNDDLYNHVNSQKTLYKYSLKSNRTISNGDDLYSYNFHWFTRISKFFKDIDYEKLQTGLFYNSNDVQLINSLEQLHYLQYFDNGYLPVVLSLSDVDGNRTMEILADRISRGEAPVFSFYIEGSDEAHAVNIYKMEEKNNKYILYYYDNNYPGDDSLYFNVECSNGGCYITNNKYVYMFNSNYKGETNSTFYIYKSFNDEMELLRRAIELTEDMEKVN